MTAWYNEIDPRAANTLEELIAAGEIAPGVVDRRSIVDVRPEDLRGFTQCHFFAGIGVWSHALRRSGWPDDRPCWTGSCPCQPFSLAGKGGGFDDPRHLWPHWFRLYREHRPDFCFGEQVASADLWLDLVRADLEDIGVAFAAVDLAAAGFAGAHIRQRFFWVADAYNTQWWADNAPGHLGDWSPTGRLESDGDAAGRGAVGGLAYGGGGGCEEHPQRNGGALVGELGAPLRDDALRCGSNGGVGDANGGQQGAFGGISGRQGTAAPRGSDGWLADFACSGWWQECSNAGWGVIRMPAQGRSPGPLGGGADWLLCHDGAWRPVEPGTFPLVAEAPARVGRLHGLGNAIDAETLTQFISAYIDAVEAGMAA